MSKRIVLVTGATGAQGGSVARHLLRQDQYSVRAMTRSTNSSKAKELQRLGAEIVYGDLNDPNSLIPAMQGVHAVFGVTNFWEHLHMEYQQGKNLVDAVVECNVSQFILSTLPPANEISNGSLKVPHYDNKAALENYGRSVKPDTIFVHVAAYYENFYNYYLPQRGYDGKFYFGFPQGHAKYAAVAVEDIGAVVVALFREYSFYSGRAVGIVGDDLSPSLYADIMSEILQKPIRYNHIHKEEFAAFDFPGAPELANMFEFNRRFISERQAELEESRSLYPQIRTFRDWLKENKERFYLPVAGSWLLTGS